MLQINLVCGLAATIYFNAAFVDCFVFRARALWQRCFYLIHLVIFTDPLKGVGQSYSIDSRKVKKISFFILENGELELAVDRSSGRCPVWPVPTSFKAQI